MERLLFGCGYLGRRVARLWRAAGDEVSAVTRSADRAREFSAEGLTPILADVTDATTLTNLPSTDTVLFAVGFDRAAGPSIHEVYAEGFRRVLDALPDASQRIVYISTTGVYGGAGGDWVDEQTPPNPQRDGGRASLAAEEALRASQFADRGVSLRLAGIYGPGRVPLLDKLKAGEPIAAPSGGRLNLIHVDDAASVVLSAVDQPAQLPPVFCVSDGQPPVRGDYYREAARLIGAPAPAFVDPPADSPRAARAAADKKVRSDLMKRVLDVTLAYPDYRSGLAAILGEAE